MTYIGSTPRDHWFEFPLPALVLRAKSYKQTKIYQKCAKKSSFPPPHKKKEKHIHMASESQ